VIGGEEKEGVWIGRKEEKGEEGGQVMLSMEVTDRPTDRPSNF
jgi:hypothetical protein